MNYYEIAAFLVVISAVFGYINEKYLKLPTTIGLMLIAIVFTLIVIVSSYIDPFLFDQQKQFIQGIDFSEVLLDVMLSFMLFAGAMHTNFEQLKIQRRPVLGFAFIGTLISTLLVGGFTYIVFHLLGFSVDFIYTLLFGALISPTDPIAVLGILKKIGINKKIETIIVGESLFNDGIGVVIFLTIYKIASHGLAGTKTLDVLKLFGIEVFGGIALGLFLGWIAYKMMKEIDNFDTEVMVTLALVMGGSLLAHKIHVSAPLTMVTAGLVIGNDTVRNNAMSEITEAYVDKFWELIDVLLNTVLFVMIGMELLVISFKLQYVVAGLISIVIVLVSRYLSVKPLLSYFQRKFRFIPKTDWIMTWGGLRGGISIALSLSLPKDMYRDLFLVMTYMVVVFSIIIQGLTLPKFIQKVQPDQNHGIN